jgi:hypothetical protein
MGFLFRPRRGRLDATGVKLFVEMGEFSPGVLEEEFADENEGGSKHIDGQESHVGQDGCGIFAPKNELVRGEKFQFTHEQKPRASRRAMVTISALAIIRGSFQSESSKVFPQDSPSGMGNGP